MGYFDFEARFDVALFDRSSFDYLIGLQNVSLPLSVATTVLAYSASVSIPDYDVSISVPTYTVSVSRSS